MQTRPKTCRSNVADVMSQCGDHTIRSIVGNKPNQSLVILEGPARVRERGQVQEQLEISTINSICTSILVDSGDQISRVTFHQRHKRYQPDLLADAIRVTHHQPKMFPSHRQRHPSSPVPCLCFQRCENERFKTCICRASSRRQPRRLHFSSMRCPSHAVVSSRPI